MELRCYRGRPDVTVNSAPVGVDTDSAWLYSVVFLDCVFCRFVDTGDWRDLPRRNDMRLAFLESVEL